MRYVRFENPQGFATAHAWLNLEGFAKLRKPCHRTLYSRLLTLWTDLFSLTRMRLNGTL